MPGTSRQVFWGMATRREMKSRRQRLFLLLEDDTVGSVVCENFRSPARHQGKSVIFATPQIKDIDLLRMMLKSTTIGN
jgi:hypothetical protein